MTLDFEFDILNNLRGLCVKNPNLGKFKNSVFPRIHPFFGVSRNLRVVTQTGQGMLPREETRLAVVNEVASHFFFVPKRKKTVRKTNPFANVVKKHVGQVFSPARKNPRLFSDSQTVVSF